MYMCVLIVIVYIMDVKVNCEWIKLNIIELHKQTTNDYVDFTVFF